MLILTLKFTLTQQQIWVQSEGLEDGRCSMTFSEILQYFIFPTVQFVD